MIIKGRIWKEQVSISSDGVDNINIFYNIDDTVYIMDDVDVIADVIMAHFRNP